VKRQEQIARAAPRVLATVWRSDWPNDPPDMIDEKRRPGGTE